MISAGTIEDDWDEKKRNGKSEKYFANVKKVVIVKQRQFCLSIFLQKWQVWCWYGKKRWVNLFLCMLRNSAQRKITHIHASTRIANVWDFCLLLDSQPRTEDKTGQECKAGNNWKDDGSEIIPRGEITLERTTNYPLSKKKQKPNGLRWSVGSLRKK